MPLTVRQRDVLGVIRKYRKEKGYSPTLTEIAKAMCLSKTSVYGHIVAMVEKGALKRGKHGSSRTYEPVDEELIARDDVNEAIDRVAGPDDPDGEANALYQEMKKAIEQIPNRS